MKIWFIEEKLVYDWEELKDKISNVETYVHAEFKRKEETMKHIIDENYKSLLKSEK